MKKMCVLLTLSIFVFLFSKCKKDKIENTEQEPVIPAENTVADYDANVYKTITIGTQVWMAANLKVTHYADGTPIPNVTDDNEWAVLQNNNTDKAYCYLNNNANGEAQIYGALYTYAAATNGASGSNANPSGVQGICPNGWHLPSEAEWQVLTNYLIANAYNYDATTEGNKIAKAMASKTHWSASVEEGSIGYEKEKNNSSDFTGLPGGYRINCTGNCQAAGGGAYWWSASQNDVSMGICFSLQLMLSSLYKSDSYKSRGFSVRCVKN